MTNNVNQSPITLSIDIGPLEAQVQQIVNSNRKISENYENLLEQFSTFEDRMENHVQRKIDSIFNAKYESDQEIQCNLKEIERLEKKKDNLKAEILEIRDELKSLKDIKGGKC